MTLSPKEVHIIFELDKPLQNEGKFIEVIIRGKKDYSFRIHTRADFSDPEDMIPASGGPVYTTKERVVDAIEKITGKEVGW